MKFLYKLFIGAFAMLLCLSDTRAEIYSCPPGCFCLGNGKYESQMRRDVTLGESGGEIQGVSDYTADDACNYAASTISQGVYDEGINNCHVLIVANRQEYDETIKHNPEFEGDYFFSDEFSELYYGRLGVYGFKKNGEFIYSCGLGGFKNIFQCPKLYPNSDKGAKALTDCYKYGANGSKVYYGGNGGASSSESSTDGWVAGVVCQPGTYMPANATKCTTCTINDTCPGGFFYTDKTYTVNRGVIKSKTNTTTTTSNNKKDTKQGSMGIRKASKVQIYR